MVAFTVGQPLAARKDWLRYLFEERAGKREFLRQLATPSLTVGLLPRTEGRDRGSSPTVRDGVLGHGKRCSTGEASAIDSRVILDSNHSLVFMRLEDLFKLRKHWFELGIAGLRSV